MLVETQEQMSQISGEKLTRFNFHGDVIRGLRSKHKTLPSKYLYDDQGAKLFDQICDLPEYYITRTELAILRERSKEMAGLAGKTPVLFELGSGSFEKASLLIRAMDQVTAYVPIDISRKQLWESSARIREEFPWIKIIPLCMDFTQANVLPDLHIREEGNRIFFFPGSTIGNFPRREACALLSQVRKWIGSHGALIIGVDLRKDLERLIPAYNDAQGVTAAFNLNLLQRINRDLGANFNLNQFRHQAIYNFREDRVEMHLESACDQTVTIGDAKIHFLPFETIHTESSYKYTISGFQDLARQAGFDPLQVWVDPEELFSVHYLAIG